MHAGTAMFWSFKYMLICITYQYMQIFELQQETNAFSMFAQNKHAARACLTHEQLITQIRTGRHDWFYYTSTKCAIPDDIRTTMPKMFTSFNFLRCPCLYTTYMCIYVYMCVNVHVHVYIYIHIYIYIYIHTHTHKQYIHTSTHTCAKIYAQHSEHEDT